MAFIWRNYFPFIFIVGVLLFGLYMYIKFIPRSTVYIKDSIEFQPRLLATESKDCPEKPQQTRSSQQTSRFQFFKTNYTTERFTIVMPTYRRTKQLPKVLKHYCSIPNVDKILVIWNNVDQNIPERILNFKCEVTVQVMKMKENKLTNRFVLYPEIQTEAIYAVDDDRMVDSKGMTLGFNTWRMLPHLIVGFCPRTHSDQSHGKFSYGGKHVYSMILTNSVFLHRNYIYMFTHELPKVLFDFVDKHKNGEDIIMNAMVADFLKRTDRVQCPSVLVDGKTQEVHGPPVDGYNGLFHRKNHTPVRSECLTLIAKVYGYMPLIYCPFKIVSS